MQGGRCQPAEDDPAVFQRFLNALLLGNQPFGLLAREGTSSVRAPGEDDLVLGFRHRLD